MKLNNFVEKILASFGGTLIWITAVASLFDWVWLLGVYFSLAILSAFDTTNDNYNFGYFSMNNFIYYI